VSKQWAARVVIKKAVAFENVTAFFGEIMSTSPLYRILETAFLFFV